MKPIPNQRISCTLPTTGEPRHTGGNHSASGGRPAAPVLPGRCGSGRKRPARSDRPVVSAAGWRCPRPGSIRYPGDLSMAAEPAVADRLASIVTAALRDEY